MPLEMRKTSEWWYGRYAVNGRRKCENLGVKIAGRRPCKGFPDGDEIFRLSKMKALTKLQARAADAKSNTTAERHLEMLYEMKSGESARSVPLKDMGNGWSNLPGRRERSQRYVAMGLSVISQFAAFLAEAYPSAKTMADVTPKMAHAFLSHLKEKKVAPRTWNCKLILLRSAFKRLARQAALASNPFSGIPTQDEQSVHRKPFTEDELRAILASADDFTRPVIVTAVCTAMRRGDCCLLKWSDVDLKQGFVVVKTSKTGETAEIPLFGPLREEIEKQKRGDSEYIFPEQARLFQQSRYSFTDRTMKVFRKAGIVTHEVRPNGKNRASVKDFHSFRTTWITIALSAGVPMELVRRVTGHATVDVVLRHYFRPGRDDFRNALVAAMPKLITGAEAEEAPRPEDRLAEVIGMVRGQTDKNWKAVRKAILSKVSNVNEASRDSEKRGGRKI